MSKNGRYNNPNGYYTEEELLKLKHMSKEDFNKVINKGFREKTWKCPPAKYETVNCFYCIQCIKNTINLIKDKK